MKLKTISLFLFTVLVFSFPAQAQTIGRAAIRGSSSTKGLSGITKQVERPFLYAWPKQSAAQISARIQTGKFGRNELEPLVQVRAQRAELATWTQYSAEGQAFLLLQQERAHYEPEIMAGNMLLQQIRQIQTINPQDQALLQSQINTLNSNYLKEILTPLAQKGNLHQLEMELADYYGLTANPARSAYNYSLRHPHKPTLWMRRLLRNPLIDTSVQETLRQFLEMPTIPQADRPSFLELLEKADNQYRDRSLLAQNAGLAAMQSHLDFVSSVNKNLQHFLQENSRLPKYDAQDPAETQLYHDVSYIREHANKVSADPALLQAYKDLQTVWINGKSQEKLKFYQKTLQSLEAFIEANGRRPKWNTLDENEFQLYQNISFIQKNREYVSTRPILQEIFDKLEAVWDSHAPQIWPYEEMLRRYEQYGIETGKWGMPQNLRNDPNLTPEQIELYDNVAYYVFSLTKTLTDLRNIADKYTSAQ